MAKKYKILDDLMYQGETLPPGATSDLSALSKEQVESLVERKKVIDAALWKPEKSDVEMIADAQKKAEAIIKQAEEEAKAIIDKARGHAEKIKSGKEK